MSKQYQELSVYYADLSFRHAARQAWISRHPDYMTELFQTEVDAYYANSKPQDMVFQSSFNPKDEPPHTADVFTAEMLLNIMAVALQAWEKKND